VERVGADLVNVITAGLPAPDNVVETITSPILVLTPLLLE